MHLLNQAARQLARVNMAPYFHFDNEVRRELVSMWGLPNAWNPDTEELLRGHSALLFVDDADEGKIVAVMGELEVNDEPTLYQLNVRLRELELSLARNLRFITGKS